MKVNFEKEKKVKVFLSESEVYEFFEERDDDDTPDQVFLITRTDTDYEALVFDIMQEGITHRLCIDNNGDRNIVTNEDIAFNYNITPCTIEMFDDYDITLDFKIKDRK